MKIIDLLPQFKRYAIIERGITPRVTKDIMRVVKNLTQSGYVTTLKNSSTSSIRNFLYEEKQSKGWCGRTFRNNRQYLKSFFNYCINTGLIETNPVNKIEKPRIPKSLPRSISEINVDRVLFHCDTHKWMSNIETKRNQAIVRTFLYTGIRLSELLNLKTEHVNLGEREILIKNGKGRKDRIVPIHHSLQPFLKQYEKSKKNASRFYFCSLYSDSPLTDKNLYRIIKVIRIKSGVYFTPHMLRHTMAKRSIEANLNPFILQAILGHSDISTTQIYVSTSIKSIKDGYSKLDL